MKLKVGDTVFVNTSGRADDGGFLLVTKVGRKYFKAGGYEFQLEDGKSTSGYSWPRAYTLEEHEENVRVEEAEKAMLRIGITVDYGQKDRRAILLEVYQEIRPIIERRA